MTIHRFSALLTAKTASTTDKNKMKPSELKTIAHVLAADRVMQ
jgi:hypothetical protein